MMISNEFSKQEREKFINKIADPYKFQQFIKQYFNITLPNPPKEDE